MRVILLGPPGAGKGTQATGISEKLGIAHVATGDLFRDHQQRGTTLGIEAKSYMGKGALVPDEVTIQMLLERIGNSDCQTGFLLDGFPRTLAQANSLDKALSVQGIQLDLALAIDVSESELLRRLGGRLICRSCQVPYHQYSAPSETEGKCDRCGGDLYQRDDDKPESVTKRIQVYQEQTHPLIEYYENQSKLRKVDGEQPMDVVAKALEAALGS